MPDYNVNPSKKAFAAVGTVRGIPAVQTSAKGNEYIKFNFSVDSEMPLFTVTVFDKDAIAEAKTFADRDVVFVGGVGESREYNGKTYYNVTARGCCQMSKLYGSRISNTVAASAAAAVAATPASNAWKDVEDNDLPFA